MTRHVTREANSPRYLDEDDIDPEKGDIAVCRCGLSGDHPFCDGSHRRTEDEGDGVYRYVDGERREIASVTFADGETVSYGHAADGGVDSASETADDAPESVGGAPESIGDAPATDDGVPETTDEESS